MNFTPDELLAGFQTICDLRLELGAAQAENAALRQALAEAQAELAELRPKSPEGAPEAT